MHCNVHVGACQWAGRVGGRRMHGAGQERAEVIEEEMKSCAEERASCEEACEGTLAGDQRRSQHAAHWAPHRWMGKPQPPEAAARLPMGQQAGRTAAPGSGAQAAPAGSDVDRKPIGPRQAADDGNAVTQR